MVSLPGLPPAIGADGGLYQPKKPFCDCPEWRAELEHQASYVRHLINIVEELQEDGNRRYGDDLLQALNHMTGDSHWLEQAVQDYPHGDRTLESEALLYRQQR